LAGTILALALVILPALAQNNQARTVTTTTYTSTTTAYDMTMPVSPESDEIIALQSLSDRNFTKRDCEKVLPLLMDLQTAEDNYFDQTHYTVFTLASAHDATKIDMSAPGGYYAYQQGFRDKRDRIWAACDKEIGSDKCNALRNLIEPQRVDLSITNYHTAWLDRIDQDLREWDRISAARMAANGQTPNTSTTVTVSTTTTNVDTSVIPDTFYTFAPLTTRELVDVVWMKMTARHPDPEAWMSIRGPGEVTSPDMQFVREHHLRSWQ